MKATLQDNSLTQELLINSYEARLLFSGYNLFELEDKDFVIDLPIEKDLYLLYELLKDMKIDCQKFNNAVLFFYRWCYNVARIKIEQIDYKNKHEIFLFFLFLHRDLAVFLFLLEDYTQSGELEILDEDETRELKDYFKGFQEKYCQIYYIFNVYRAIVSQIKTFIEDNVEDELDLARIIDEILVDRFFLMLGSIDNEMFSNCLNLAKDMLYDETPNRYEVLRKNILESISKIGGINKNCIVRDCVIQTKNGARVYKAILAKFDICNHSFIYSNVGTINAFELSGTKNLFTQMLVPIDKFVLWYQLCASNIQNYLYYINKCENRYGISYPEVIKIYYKYSLEKAKRVIDKQLEVLFNKMPKTELFSFFSVLQNKIAHNVRGFFYHTDKALLKKLGTGDRVRVEDFSLGDCKVLFDSISELIREIFLKRSSDNVAVKSQNSTN